MANGLVTAPELASDVGNCAHAGVYSLRLGFALTNVTGP